MDEEFQKEKKKRQEEAAKNALMLLQIADLTLTRYKEEEDPVIRYTLFVDKFLLLVEIGMSAGRKALKEETDDNVECMDKFDKLLNELQKELKGLAKWIKSPIYSPDHNFGEKIMKESQQLFEKRI